MLNQFLTHCDTKGQLFVPAGERSRWQRDDQTLSAQKSSLCSRAVHESDLSESTIRRVVPTTTIETRRSMAKMTSLWPFLRLSKPVGAVGVDCKLIVGHSDNAVLPRALRRGEGGAETHDRIRPGIRP
jgi:hypothetical protein